MAYQQQTVYVQGPQGQLQAQPQYVHVHGQPSTLAGQVVAQPQTAPANNQRRGRENFAKESQKICGIIQIVLGVLAMVIGGTMISLSLNAGSGIAVVGTGIWCGVFIIIAGSFGVGSAYSETTGLIVTCMVMSILASLFGFIFFIMSAIACGIDDAWHWGDASLNNGRVAVDVIGILVGLSEIVVSVIQSAICCRTTCCGGPKPPPTIVYVPQPFPAQYSLQTQGTVQATNIPAVIQPGGAVYPAVGHAGAQQGYAPQQGNVPQQGYAQQQGYSQPGLMQDGQPTGASAAPPQYSLQGPVPPAYSEKPPASYPDN
ncbi:uncharacterized protein LOC135498198 [Lineus longissimus]|uniref:uncharacterized protein LOC135498198 n=1 Tax=Lineus longissimus TaxID=88925 RepID=UPI00315D2F4F